MVLILMKDMLMALVMHTAYSGETLCSDRQYFSLLWKGASTVSVKNAVPSFAAFTYVGTLFSESDYLYIYLYYGRFLRLRSEMVPYFSRETY